MAKKNTQSSGVGVVESRCAHFDAPLTLRSGEVIGAYDLVYETYGKLNADASNAILVCHALSGHHHVAGHYADQPGNIGWWDNIVGPGRPLAGTARSDPRAYRLIVRPQFTHIDPVQAADAGEGKVWYDELAAFVTANSPAGGVAVP